MQSVTGQLHQVRRRAKALLVVQRLSRFVTAAAVVMLILAFVDFALDLPGWLRLISGLFIGAEGAVWLTLRLLRVARFNPSLSELALRAERVYPKLTGVLASSVEFSSAGGPADTTRGGALAGLAVQRALELLEGVKLSRLIDPSYTAKCLVVMLAALLFFGGVVLSAPDASRTAAMRWLMPLGSTQWPRRVLIEDATGLSVWPIDAPPRVVAEIQRGYRPGMRVHVHYRLTGADGQDGLWTQVLMTEQSNTAEGQAASFERLIDIPPFVVRSVHDRSDGQAVLTYYLSAGDGQTQPARVTLVARPAVVDVLATIRPPVYAAGLADIQEAALHRQSGQIASASALVGSSVRLDVRLSKPVSVTEDHLPDVLPGLIDLVGLDQIELQELNGSSSQTDAGFSLAFRLDTTFQTPIRVTDEHGLNNLSQRRYQIEAVIDKPPSVAMILPAADEAVLAFAEVPVSATAQDDVGLEQIELVAEIKKRSASGQSPGESLPTLARQTGRRTSLGASAGLDLSQLQLRPGDEVILSALASDVFDLDGHKHEPVRSAPRSLRIIDEPTLIAQMRSELAGLRQQVVRLEQTQRRIETDRPPSVTQPQQAQVTRRLGSQEMLLDALQDRADRNRLDDQPMTELIDQAGKLISQAQQHSSRAADRLGQAVDQPEDTDALQEQAQVDQQAVRHTLTQLAELLDQGRDVLTLKLQLQQLKTQQQSLATDTRALLPQTVGQDKDQLPDEMQDQLEELEHRQDELSQQAQALTRQMQATADALARQGERDQDQAAAEALAEAAAIGQRQGLGESMQQSSEAIQQNQLSQAGQNQDRAMDALDRMLAEMGTQEKRRQAILRRRLAELSELIRKLLERQVAQAQTLERSDAQAVPALQTSQAALRRATMGAQHRASGSEEAEQVRSALEEAVTEQGTAVGALGRGENLTALTAERAAADHLRSALEQLEKIVKDTALEQARKERQALREAYEKYAKRQDGLRDQVRAIVDVGPLDRKRRAALVSLSGGQSELQRAIAETGQKVEKTLVFEYMHDSMGTASSRAVSMLRRGDGGEGVRADQRSIATMLRVMAEALKEDPNNDPFTGESGGGGDGGGGGDAPLVPPLAELKLFRGMQQVVYDQTRSAETSLAGQPDEPMKQKMLELSTRQRELSALGQRLIEKMKQQRQAPEVAPRIDPERAPKPTGDHP